MGVYFGEYCTSFFMKAVKFYGQDKYLIKSKTWPSYSYIPIGSYNCETKVIWPFPALMLGMLTV